LEPSLGLLTKGYPASAEEAFEQNATIASDKERANLLNEYVLPAPRIRVSCGALPLLIFWIT
jgi:hypothetical protein